MIEGVPGAGKSSLALALVDRGAVLVGDDGVLLELKANRLVAHPPPEIAGKLEIRGVGIVDLPTVSAPLALVLSLGGQSERLPEAEIIDYEGASLPRLPFNGDALRAEWVLRLHGIAD